MIDKSNAPSAEQGAGKPFKVVVVKELPDGGQTRIVYTNPKLLDAGNRMVNDMTFDPGMVRLDSIKRDKPRWWQFWRWFEREYRVQYKFTVNPSKGLSK